MAADEVQNKSNHVERTVSQLSLRTHLLPKLSSTVDIRPFWSGHGLPVPQHPCGFTVRSVPILFPEEAGMPLLYALFFNSILGKCPCGSHLTASHLFTCPRCELVKGYFSDVEPGIIGSVHTLKLVVEYPIRLIEALERIVPSHDYKKAADAIMSIKVDQNSLFSFFEGAHTHH